MARIDREALQARLERLAGSAASRPITPEALPPDDGSGERGAGVVARLLGGVLIRDLVLVEEGWRDRKTGEIHPVA